nr:PREDICTED: apolipophorins-like [Latimeria chalumnae]|eukprot:XP_006010930.2 PREDICTED: apolipophorins-like [Latimeria chalumnae]
MGLQAVVLLCAVAGTLGRTLKASKQEAPCVKDCTGTNQLNFHKGYRYIYKYSTSTSTFLQGSSYERSGISLESTVGVEVLDKCHMVLKVYDVQIAATASKENEPIKGLENLRDELQKNPLQFSFQDGKIPNICPSEGEELWVLNVKRGILSVLQNSYTANEEEIAEEVDVSGKCLTTYQLTGSVLVKTKDLNSCTHRSSLVTSLQSVALPHIASQQQFLSSQQECMQSYKDGVLEEATCSESHLLQPFSRRGNGAKTESHSMLRLLKTENEISSNRANLQQFYVSNLLYEDGNGKKDRIVQSNGEQVAETVRILCLANSMTYESADLFMTLVFRLRGLSVDTLRDLWQRASFKCRDDWQPLLDALPTCGTEACVNFMKEIILSKELEESNIESFLWSMAFIPEPTAGMINDLTILLQSPEASQSVFLTATSLVHNFCTKTSICDSVPEVQALMKILERYLGESCTALETQEVTKMQLVLKAIGNAGLAATSLIPTLSSCAKSRQGPAEIRVAAVEAFRRIPCAANHSVLIQIYQDSGEDTEIRIASYFTLMKCPNEDLLKIVRQTLRKEKSSQG